MASAVAGRSDHSAVKGCSRLDSSCRRLWSAVSPIRNKIWRISVEWRSKLWRSQRCQLRLDVLPVVTDAPHPCSGGQRLIVVLLEHSKGLPDSHLFGDYLGVLAGVAVEQHAHQPTMFLDLAHEPLLQANQLNTVDLTLP